MRFFIDTNVCSKAASQTGPGIAWPTIRDQLLRRGFSYVVCPLVTIELLDALAGSQDIYFGAHKGRFEVLRSGVTEYLRFPGDFALHSVFDVGSAASALGPADFRQWTDTVCAANSLGELRSGKVRAYGSNLVTKGMDLNMVLGFRQAGLNHHQARMRAIAASKSSHSPRSWALSIIRSQGVITRDIAELDEFAKRLSAAYEYDKYLAKLVAKTPYRFDAKNRSGDRIDSEILFYLAAPDLHIITDDGDIRKRCAASPQADRILQLSELAEAAYSRKPPLE